MRQVIPIGSLLKAAFATLSMFLVVGFFYIGDANGSLFVAIAVQLAILTILVSYADKSKNVVIYVVVIFFFVFYSTRETLLFFDQGLFTPNFLVNIDITNIIDVVWIINYSLLSICMAAVFVSLIFNKPKQVSVAFYLRSDLHKFMINSTYFIFICSIILQLGMIKTLGLDKYPLIISMQRFINGAGMLMVILIYMYYLRDRINLSRKNRKLIVFFLVVTVILSLLSGHRAAMLAIALDFCLAAFVAGDQAIPKRLVYLMVMLFPVVLLILPVTQLFRNYWQLTSQLGYTPQQAISLAFDYIHVSNFGFQPFIDMFLHRFQLFDIVVAINNTDHKEFLGRVDVITEAKAFIASFTPIRPFSMPEFTATFWMPYILQGRDLFLPTKQGEQPTLIGMMLILFENYYVIGVFLWFVILFSCYYVMRSVTMRLLILVATLQLLESGEIAPMARFFVDFLGLYMILLYLKQYFKSGSRCLYYPETAGH